MRRLALVLVIDGHVPHLLVGAGGGQELQRIVERFRVVEGQLVDVLVVRIALQVLAEGLGGDLELGEGLLDLAVLLVGDGLLQVVDGRVAQRALGEVARLQQRVGVVLVGLGPG